MRHSYKYYHFRPLYPFWECVCLVHVFCLWSCVLYKYLFLFRVCSAVCKTKHTGIKTLAWVNMRRATWLLCDTFEISSPLPMVSCEVWRCHSSHNNIIIPVGLCWLVLDVGHKATLTFFPFACLLQPIHPITPSPIDGFLWKMRHFHVNESER